MKWILAGALLGLLLMLPALWMPVVTVAAAVLAKPVLVAFAGGLAAARLLPRRYGGWAR